SDSNSSLNFVLILFKIFFPKNFKIILELSSSSNMALESFLRLNPKEKFDRNHKRLEISDCQELIENEHHPFNLSIPRISLNLNSLYDASNPSKKIAMKFNKGTTTLAFVYKGGVVVCADSRATGGQYISTQHCKKIIVINDFLLGTMAGGAADCSYGSEFSLKNVVCSN
ncbi:hypothetical protein SSS_05788, partial [Sarcoptes scabiei]